MPEGLHTNCSHSAVFLFICRAGVGRNARTMPFLIEESLLFFFGDCACVVIFQLQEIPLVPRAFWFPFWREIVPVFPSAKTTLIANMGTESNFHGLKWQRCTHRRIVARNILHTHQAALVSSLINSIFWHRIKHFYAGMLFFTDSKFIYILLKV